MKLKYSIPVGKEIVQGILSFDEVKKYKDWSAQDKISVLEYISKSNDGEPENIWDAYQYGFGTLEEET